MKSILNVKIKTSNLIKCICSHKICSGMKIQPVKRTICHSVPKTFSFSQSYSVPFHRVTFDHSISCVLLIDKPNESCQNSKKIKEMAYPPRKTFLKRKGNRITPVQTNAQISQTSSERLKLRNKELRMKLGQLQEEISKASLSS